MGQRTLRKSFNGGEVTPELYGLVDDAKFQSGLALCRNFVVLPHGPVANRAGFRYVRATAVYPGNVRLIPFVFNVDQTLVIEMGPLYFRFHTQGGTILSGGVPLQVSHSVPGSQLFTVRYDQSNDIVTFVGQGFAPFELRRLGATSWAVTTIPFGSPLSAPAISAALSSASGTRNYAYVATCVGADGIEESAPSAIVTNVNDLTVAGSWTNIVMNPASVPVGTPRINIYRADDISGSFGYVGTIDIATLGVLTLSDRVSRPDYSRSPPQFPNALVGDNPIATTWFEQRRVFAGTPAAPLGVFMTRTGSPRNFARSIPIRDNDGIVFSIASRDASRIQHLVPLGDVLALSASTEYRVRSVEGGALTPSTVSAKPQSYIGANDVRPLVINNSVLFCANRGGHVREMGYDDTAGGYVTGDLSLRAPHLFDTFTIVDSAFSKAPVPTCWFVSSNGKLLGLTYIPEQNIGAWHQHDTDGAFESVCCVAEGSEDVLYAVVRRNVGGVDVRYIERMESRQFTAVSDAFYVDCGATYSGSPTTTVSGLTWLEGKEVAILADGAVHPRRTVVGGSVTLEAAASKVQIGLPITADMQTLPMALEVDGAFGQGRVKNINTAWIRVSKSGGFLVGPSFDRMVPAKVRRFEPYGSPPELKTDQIQVEPPADWQDDGALCIRQADPLPLTVVSFGLEVALGG